MTLFAAAVAASVLDGVAYLALITTGRVAELNPLIAGKDPLLVIGAKALLVCGLGLLTVTYRNSPEAWRLVRRVLGVAVVVGVVGAVSTVAAL